MKNRIRAIIAGVGATAAVAAGGALMAPAAQAAPATTAAGYYRTFADCASVGHQGVVNGAWDSYSCVYVAQAWIESGYKLTTAKNPPASTSNPGGSNCPWYWAGKPGC